MLGQSKVAVFQYQVTFRDQGTWRSCVHSGRSPLCSNGSMWGFDEKNVKFLPESCSYKFEWPTCFSEAFKSKGTQRSQLFKMFSLSTRGGLKYTPLTVWPSNIKAEGDWEGCWPVKLTSKQILSKKMPQPLLKMPWRSLNHSRRTTYH